MHIAFLCHEYPPYVNGGLGRYAERITRFLAAADQSVAIFTMRIPGRGTGQGVTDRGPAEARPTGAPMSVHRVGLPALLRDRLPDRVFQLPVINMLNQGLGYLLYNARVVRLVANKARKQDFDIIAVHDWMSTPAGIVSALLLRKAVVFHVHSNEVSTGLWRRGAPIIEHLVRWAEDLQHRLARRVIVPSHEARDILARRGWSRTKLTVIPHGFEDEVFASYRRLSAEASTSITAELRARLGLRRGEQVVLFVGRLVEHKGIHTLLRAFARVCQDRDRIALVLGSAPACRTPRTIRWSRGRSSSSGSPARSSPTTASCPRTRWRGTCCWQTSVRFRRGTSRSGWSRSRRWSWASRPSWAVGFPRSSIDSTTRCSLTSTRSTRAAVAGRAALTMTGDDPEESPATSRRFWTTPCWRASSVGRTTHVERRFCWERAVTSTLRTYSEACGRRSAAEPDVPG